MLGNICTQLTKKKWNTTRHVSGGSRTALLLFADDVAPAGFIGSRPPAFCGVVRSWGWSGQDEDQCLQIRGILSRKRIEMGTWSTPQWGSSSISGSCAQMRAKCSRRSTGGLVLRLQWSRIQQAFMADLIFVSGRVFACSYQCVW